MDGWVTIVLAVGVSFVGRSFEATACSDFLLNVTYDVVSARTMDFDIDLKTVLELIPVGTNFSDLPVAGCQDCPDFSWRNKYGYIGLQAGGMDPSADGLNEKGLSAAWLFLVGSEYPKPDANDSRPMVSSICSYILGNFATVEEVESGLRDIQVVQPDAMAIGLLEREQVPHELPLHIVVHDAEGKNLVVEFIKGEMKMHRNPNGVITNAPDFDWHLTNVWQRNPHQNIPGDWSSASRFLRLHYLNKLSIARYFPGSSYSIASPEQESIAKAVHLISLVQRPPGLQTNSGTDFIDRPVGATQWSIVRDHRRKKIYFRSNENQLLRLIDLSRLNFHGERKAISVTFGEWVVDETSSLTTENITMDIPPRSVVRKIVKSIQHGSGAENPDILNTQQLQHSYHHGSLALGVVVGIAVGVMVATVMTFQPQRLRYRPLWN